MNFFKHAQAASGVNSYLIGASAGVGNTLGCTSAHYGLYAQQQQQMNWQMQAEAYNNTVALRYRRRKPRRDCPSCGAPWKENCDYCGEENGY
jgi:hypothetical protein